jgi:error-prone DNA polymerase
MSGAEQSRIIDARAGGEYASIEDFAERARPSRPLLERLAEVQDELTAALIAARADTARELAALQHGRGAVRGYATGAAPGGGWVDESH